MHHKTSFSPAFVHVPSLHSFLVNKSDQESMKNQNLFMDHNIAMLKIATEAHLFDSYEASTDLHQLQTHVKSYVLPISSNSQHIESKIKDISLCKTIGRSEITTSCLHNDRS